MNDNKKPYEAGTRCPHCGGEMLDGGYVGRYCSNGPKCGTRDPLEVSGDGYEPLPPISSFEINIYTEPEVKAIRKAAVEAFRARLLSALDDKLSPTISKLSTRNKALLEAMGIVEALEVEG